MCCSEGTTLAKDVLRMQPVTGMPKYIYQAPLWHMHALCDLLGVGLTTLRTDDVQPKVWPAHTEASNSIHLTYDGQHYMLAN